MPSMIQTFFRSRLFRGILLAWVLGALLIAPFSTAFAEDTDAIAAQKAKAAAIGAGMPTVITGNIPESIGSTVSFITNQLVQAGVVAFLNAAQSFFGTLAYDAASYIASGGQGQDALYYKQSFGKYMESVAANAAGELVGSFSEELFKKNNIAFDLCAPTLPRDQQRLSLALGSMFAPFQVQSNFQRPTPKCDIRNVMTNWDGLVTTLGRTEIYDVISFSLSANSSGIGSFNSLVSRYNAKIIEEVQSKANDRKEGGGFKAVSNIISGNVKTPSQLVAAETKSQLVDNPKQGQLAVTSAVFNNAFKIGLPALFQYTASVFTNTLTSKLMKRLFERGLDGGIELVVPSSPDAVVAVNRQDTRKAFTDLKNPVLQQVTDIEIIAEMMGCPADNRGTWNCVVDQALGRAIQTQSERGGFTVRDALDQGLLHGTWKLIPDSKTKENTDRDCYLNAYCAGNLRKLRLMRILPVGFEFAANSAKNIARCETSQGCYTLQEVVGDFAKCNAAGQRDEENPWCKLVDPNWVLTAIPQRCMLNGYTDQLVTEQYAPRMQECQDVQTCLQRNDRGECVGGYGYCLAEKTAYRFGADECSAKDASCRLYTTRDGQQISYLRNSLDYGTCSESSVGCRWYSTARDTSAGADTNWVGTASSTANKTYFNAKLETCDASNEGCTELRVVRSGESALNLVSNASFEKTVDVIGPAGKVLSSWSDSNTTGRYTAPRVDEGRAGFEGSQAVSLSGNYLSQFVDVVPGRQYAFSYLVRKPSAIGAMPAVDVTLTQNPGTAQAPGTAIAAAEVQRNFITTESCQYRGQLVSVPLSNPAGLDVDWVRVQCSFVTTPNTRSMGIAITGSNVLLDAVQLEEGTAPTAFVDGLNQTLQPIHMKVAPDEFACTGSATDHPSCARFAQVCRQSEAGCQGYRDVAAGGSEIPAIVSQQDLCPQECVGYAEFRKQASAFDLVNDVDTRVSDPSDTAPSYFIPSTAEQCSQADVGCEAFTNLERQVDGGENQAYFSYVRACEKPSADSQTYYTWEGSDTTGYQLRTWSLVKATTANPGEVGPEGTAVAGGPRILLKRAPGSATFKEPAVCNERSWRGEGGVAIDPDCRQFYDAQGTIFYRFYSQTVLSTDSCTRYRVAQSNQNDCSKTGGQFDTATGECVYRVHEAESLTCSAQAASCRAFAGSQAGGTQNVISQDFRSGTVAPVVAPNGVISSEAVLVGDSSLRLDNSSAPGVNPMTASMTFVSEPTSLYRVTFYAKSANGQRTVRVFTKDGTVGSTASAQQVGQVTLSADWQRYSVGLFNGASGAAKLTSLSLSVDSPAGTVVFLDEIVVTKVPDLVYVKLNSWKTPISCDRSFAGADQPQAMLGCRAYRNRAGQTVNARQFTQLCRESAISCTAFIDTRNSADSATQTFVRKDDGSVTNVVTDQIYPTATTTRMGDRYLYLIDDPAKRCNSTQASCRAFGKPVFAPDRATITSWQTVYYKDDVTKYADALCKPSEEFCDAFGTPAGSKEYFRDPDTHICEYRTDVQVNLPTLTGRFNGYFVKDTSTPCYPDNLQDGNVFGLLRRGDTGYKGWVGLCSPEMGECTEFRDPNDVTDSRYPSGKPYFFINNDKIDKTSCASGVDQSRGCILLNDSASGTAAYSTKASYAEYEKQGYRPIAPIDCTKAANAAKCTPPAGGALYSNDANMLVKVKIDRDCAQWLGCSSAETVLDPATNRYKDVCSSLSVCNRGSANANDLFCGNYVNRATAATEPVLTKGAFFSADQYTKRQTGLGTLDYSGYTIPNSYQVADMTNTRVAVTGLPGNRDVQAKYSLEYRLAAKVRLLPTAVGATPNDAVLASAAGAQFAQVQSRYPSLRLCVHQATSRIGFDGGDGSCYLPVTAQGNLQDYDFYNLASIYTSANSDPSSSGLLERAFPPAECRANPEADSPFSEKYVTSWDFSVDPPKATSKTLGLANANTCEFGEDCSCMYKRVDFGGVVTKFVAPYSSNVLTGVCQGGPRDGQVCLPSDLYGQTRSSEAGASTSTAGSLNCGPLEGGGRCVGLSKSTLVSGIFGQCLERDTTRTVGRDSQNQPCLTWNPTPVLFGDKDRYHYSPSAAYLPPENAGQYYCTDLERPTKKIPLVQDVFERFSEYRFAGNMNKMYFDANCVNESLIPTDYCGRVTDSGLNDYGYNIGAVAYDPERTEEADRGISSMIVEGPAGNAHARGGATGPDSVPLTTQMCEKAWRAQEGTDRAGDGYDAKALRLVGTGETGNTSYVETFFKIDARLYASRIMEGMKGRTPTSSMLLIREPTPVERFTSNQEQNIEYFSIEPIKSATPAGRLGCGYSEGWVDNLKLANDDTGYGDKDALKAADQEWRSRFAQNYNPIMNRTSETFYAEDNGRGRLIKVPCLWADGNNGDNGSSAGNATVDKQFYPSVRADGSIDSSPTASDAGRQCYLKFWETDYRADGQQKFQSMYQADGRTPNGQSLDVIRKRPLTQRCTADQPYFAIRAVFQASVAQAGKTVVTPATVEGPWRFVGFWTTSCGGKDLNGDYRQLYFQVDVKQADVCSEVAEVRSANSKQDAAFTDRVWRESGYATPDANITYGVRFSPFSSALNTKVAGKDPLFQGGGGLGLSGSQRQSGFIGSGVDSYFYDKPFPKDKWAYVTNLFARVYRVYVYFDQAVTASDTACVDGPFKGQKCVTRAQAGGSTGENPYSVCSVNGVCDPTLANEDDLASNSICNSLSGINAGLSCGVKPSPDWYNANGLKSGADLCHIGPLKNNGGVYEPVFADCVAFPDFASHGLTGASWPPEAVPMQDTLGRCDNTDETVAGLTYKTSIRAGKYCELTTKGADGKGITGPSYTCPRQVQGQCNETGPNAGRCDPDSLPPELRGSYGIEQTACKHNADCSFTEKNYYVMTEEAGNLSWNAGLPLPNSRSLFVTKYDGSELANLDNIFDSEKITRMRNRLEAQPDACTKITDVNLTGLSSPYGETLCLGSVYVNRDNFSVRDCAAPETARVTYNQSLRVDDVKYPINEGGTPPFDTQAFRDVVLSNPSRVTYPTRTAGTTVLPDRSPNVWEYIRAPSTGIYAPYTFLGTELGNALSNQRWGFACLGLGGGGGQAFLANQAKCEPLKDLYSGRYNANYAKFGRCRGGIYNNRICLTPSPSAAYDCTAPGELNQYDGKVQNDGYNLCQSVTSPLCGGTPGADPDTDQNSCTHGVGYYPRAWFCPDENDEYCGLITYNKTVPASYNPLTSTPLPTDVTLGHYTPWFLGDRSLQVGSYNYIGYYTPRPPRLAAPDSASCPTPGQCKIQKMDSFSLDGISEGIQSVPGGQHKATIRFYAWAAHDQMAMRKLQIDWGDGQEQSLNDAKMKNKKPFCGVQKECWTADQGHTGLTCQSDADCPAGGGTCEPLGYCEAEPYKMCSSDNECDRVVGATNVAGKCNARSYFGNSPEACETNYFEFSHLFTCTGPESVNNIQCGASGRCSRDPNRSCTADAGCAAGDQCLQTLAPNGGCWDPAINTCRFTPRVTIQDNWGWCTGECRTVTTAGGLPEDPISSKVIHRYGGCYSGTVLGEEASASLKVRANTNGQAILPASECNVDALPSTSNAGLRPWIVFPGSLQLRAD